MGNRILEIEGQGIIIKLYMKSLFLSLKEELHGINDKIGNYPSSITGCDEQFNYLLERRSELEKRIRELSENPEIKMWEGGNIY